MWDGQIFADKLSAGDSILLRGVTFLNSWLFRGGSADHDCPNARVYSLRSDLCQIGQIMKDIHNLVGLITLSFAQPLIQRVFLSSAFPHVELLLLHLELAHNINLAMNFNTKM